MSLYIRYPSNIPSSGGGGGGSSGQIITATLYDPVDTTLPTTAPYVIDGVTLASGDTVLFSNLATGNNEVYQATITGPTITWVAQPIFNSSVTPSDGSVIVITQGTAFANQLGQFNGTTWLFNYSVRYFNGTDYFEQSSLYTVALADATTNGTVFSVAYSGSQNIVVEYSILRGTSKVVGSMFITTDGTTAVVAGSDAELSLAGVTFSAAISGSNLILQYTTTSTGSAGTMKFEMRRWSDSAGGPGGPPSYSGGAALIPAAGSNGNVQINDSGVLGASSNFSYDSVNNLLILGSEQMSILNSASLLDNQSSPTTIVVMSGSFNSVFLEYTVLRNSFVRTGLITISNDGINIDNMENYSQTGDTGVAFGVSLTGGNISVNYTSTSLGVGGTFKYAFRRW